MGERITAERVDAELRGGMRGMRFGPPVGSSWGRAVIRALQRLSRPDVAGGVTLSTVPVGAGAVRVYRPEGELSGAGLLWVHGGGYVIGQAAMDDRFCSVTARDLGLVVVSVEYRLSPEHPFPLPLDDCLAAWTWFQEHADGLGVDPARVVVGGQSAGGGLAAGLVQRLHDAGGTQPVAQLLMCPMLDDRTAARRELDAVGHWVWSNRRNRAGWAAYLGQEPGLAEVPPHAVPARRDDLAGLPPTYVGVGDIDLFHDENVSYAERLRAAGVPCDLDVVPGAPHGFESIVPASALTARYLGRARAWLRRAVGTAVA
jgi:acetyl esterase/lipase